ncbi:MAG: hypothetical protein ACYC6T_10240 [Thermoleophilia bacterium]
MLDIRRTVTLRLPQTWRHLPPGTPLVMALALWACVMLVTGAVLAPLVGWRPLAPLGFALLAALLMACWAVCAPFERAQNEWRRTVNNASKETRS